MHAKLWNFNASKKSEAVITLDLIETLRIKLWSTNQVKVDARMDDKET